MPSDAQHEPIQDAPTAAQPVLEARDLVKHFDGRNKNERVHAVNGVSFSVRAGEVVGIVGESGSGKSTIARLIARLTIPTGGALLLDGVDISAESERTFRHRRRDLQMVFQDPVGTLNPRHSIARLIEEPLLLHTGLGRTERAVRVRELASQVRLLPNLLDRIPGQLSGGQLQRVSIARAIATNPRLIVLDEPTSSLDLTVRRSIIELLGELRRTLGIAMVMISHDLSTIRTFADRVLVVYFGRIVEAGVAAEVLSRPLHPYTRFLLSAELRPDPNSAARPLAVKGEMPSPLAPPTGCSFAPRCPIAIDRCRHEPPPMVPQYFAHGASCLRLGEPMPGEVAIR